MLSESKCHRCIFSRYLVAGDFSRLGNLPWLQIFDENINRFLQSTTYRTFTGQWYPMEENVISGWQRRRRTGFIRWILWCWRLYEVRLFYFKLLTDSKLTPLSVPGWNSHFEFTKIQKGDLKHIKFHRDWFLNWKNQRTLRQGCRHFLHILQVPLRASNNNFENGSLALWWSEQS